MRPRPTLRPIPFLLATLLAAAPAAADPPGKQAPPAPPPAAFPLPLVGGKPVAAAPGQKSFRLPLGYARVAAFYRDQLRGVSGVTLVERTPREGEGLRVLEIRSLRTNDAWAKALVREEANGTTVDVTPVIRADVQDVQGVARPLVEFVIGRSDEARKAAESIDHLEK
ncbi:MAG TPA: hypothetical protein VND93_28605 [Myxococcales bacterium]|nr:hypothetical protein [Myxococcales bacterium]